MREVLLSREQIEAICKNIGHLLSEELKDEERAPMVVGVMKGGLNFTLDLIKDIDVPIITDYVQISSYSGTSQTGIISLKKDLSITDIKDRVVILVDDVVDTGYSMHYLRHFLLEKYNPKRIIICCLINKTSVRKIDVKIDYSGYELKENKFLMGYGLDYKELFRNVPYVYIPDQEEIDEYEKIAREKVL